MGSAFFIFLLLTAGGVVGYVDEPTECEFAVWKWAEKALNELEEEDSEDSKKLRDFLFFLHVPRTGGRTLSQCILRKAYSVNQSCPHSYTHLSINLSQPNCQYLTSHDDYGILSKMEKGLASVITNLRHPFDRVLSAYEFSIEIAARSVRRDNDKSKPHKRVSNTSIGNARVHNTSIGGARVSNSSVVVKRGSARLLNASYGHTLNIWPWTYLVPWMFKDLTFRHTGKTAIMEEPKRKVNLYNSPEFVMPLHEFIHHPMAFELVHNGATFQVAGITNNSHLEDAEEIRNCVLQYEDLGHYILDVAKKRIEKMFFVGLTDKHEESAKILANLIGKQMPSKWIPSNHSVEKVRLNASTNYKQDIKHLVKRYDSCINSNLTLYARPHDIRLDSISPLKSTLKGRNDVAESTMKDILRFNSLDLALYKHAQTIFNRERIALSNTVESNKTRSQEHRRLYKIEDFGPKKIYVLLLGVAPIGGFLAFFMGHCFRSQNFIIGKRKINSFHSF